MQIDLRTVSITPLRQTYNHIAERQGADKPASRYIEGTMNVQPDVNFHYRPTWDPEHELFDPRRTRLVMKDWYALKDPRQFYYGAYTQARARMQEVAEADFEFVETRGLADRFDDGARRVALDFYVPLRHVAWGANMNGAYQCAYGYGTAITQPCLYAGMDHLGVAQYLTRLGLVMDEPGVLEAGKNDWMQHPAWQPLRHLVEDLLVVQDPMELFVAQNMVLDGLLYPLIYNHFVDEHVTVQGGTAVAMLTAFMPEWHTETARWIDAVVKVAATESADNRSQLSHWYLSYADHAGVALAAVAELALGARGAAVLSEVRQSLDARARKAGLDI